KAASADTASAVGHRSKRERITEPISNGDSATRPSAAAVRRAPASSRRRQSAEARSARQPQSAISRSNQRSYAGRRSAINAGAMITGNAAGGYSSEKSRYGTFPWTILRPYFT